MVTEWYICALTPPSQAEPQLTPRKKCPVTAPSSHPAHPLHIQCHILTAVSWSLKSRRRSPFYELKLHPMLQESHNENSALDFAICIISKIKLARENREATYIKVLSSLPRTRIILWTINQDSVQVWSLSHEHQHHLGIARSAKPQALPQIY